ncbi:MAG: cobalamin biosynthesis protein CbiX [Paracoccaceae bacterium]|jgi:sirohydrochlorin ferrochelatase
MTQTNSSESPVVLVAHGQPSDPAPAERRLRQFADDVQRHLPRRRVFSATLAAPNRLETVCDQAGRHADVYPCFMANGWFTAKVLPDRLNGREHHILPPLGAEPALPEVVARFLLAKIAEQAWQAQDVELLLAAHGSARGTKAAEAAFSFIKALEPLCGFRGIRAGFVEQPPWAADSARKISTPSYCLPFFALEGDHVRTDIQDALKTAHFSGEVLPVIAEIPGVAQMVAQRLSGVSS